MTRFVHHGLALAVASAALFAFAPAAVAEHVGRPAQPVCTTTAHFEIHCASGLADASTEAAAASFEEAYARLVAGGGGEPNAGLKPPVDDGDGRTDVYFMAPAGMATFSGGVAARDPNHARGRGTAAYVYLSPDLSLSGIRFRAAHEFMHVVSRGYFGLYGPLYEEGLANWAAEHALPDVDPGDNNFRDPSRPFDCISSQCGQGYWQWLFFQRQSEDLGVDFVAAVMARAEASPSLAGDFFTPALRDELALRTGMPADVALRARFADYARKVLDPTAWRTSAVSTMYQQGGPQTGGAFELHVGTPESHLLNVTVDHLGAVYNELGFTSTNPDDDVEIRVTPPPGLLTAPDVFLGPPRGARRAVALAPDRTGAYRATIPGPLRGQTAIVPFVNDTASTDALAWEWQGRLVMARAGMKLARQRLGTVRRHGLAVTLTATKPARVTLLATVDGATARRYHVSRTITARVKRALPARSTRATLRLTGTARRRLAKAKAVRVTVAATGAFPRGTPISASAITTLRR